MLFIKILLGAVGVGACAFTTGILLASFMLGYGTLYLILAILMLAVTIGASYLYGRWCDRQNDD